MEKLDYFVSVIVGNFKIIRKTDLITGKIKSCGCMYRISNKGRNVRHNMRNTRIYNIYQSMKNRCYTKSNKEYRNYGGRGITVCNEWLEDFIIFYNWAMANGYKSNLTIDRIDVNGNYEPSNCRWSTYKEQNNNRRDNRLITYKGKEYTVAELSDYIKIPYATLLYRINNNWNENDLNLKVNLNNKNIRKERIK